jgi:hypothetical protein
MLSQLISDDDLYSCVWWSGAKNYEVREEIWFYYDYNTNQWFWGREIVYSDKPLNVSLDNL